MKNRSLGFQIFHVFMENLTAVLCVLVCAAWALDANFSVFNCGVAILVALFVVIMVYSVIPKFAYVKRAFKRTGKARIPQNSTTTSQRYYLNPVAVALIPKLIGQQVNLSHLQSSEQVVIKVGYDKRPIMVLSDDTEIHLSLIALALLSEDRKVYTRPKYWARLTRFNAHILGIQI